MLDGTKYSTASGGQDYDALCKMVDYAADEMEGAREASEQARNYYDSIQLTAAELAVLKKRKQPPLVINRIKRKIDAMVGIEQKSRIDPKALPRNPEDEDAADVATKALVYADDITRLDTHRSAFCYNLAIEGYGGVEVNVRDRNGQKDPEIIRLRWEEIFFDPFSRELDFSDASYVGIQKWMTLAKARTFCRGFNPDMSDKDLDDILTRSMESRGNTYDDRPSGASKRAWGDKKTQRVKLAYMYYQHEGEWRLALFTHGGVIYDEPSPFLDYTDNPEGVPSCGMILQACYIDQENKRYGIVSDMIPMQDEINKRRSKLLHQLNSRQTMGQKGAVTDVAKAKRELALPDGHVEYDQDPQSSVPSFQIIPQEDQIAGQFSLLQESKGEIDMLGPNASLLGQLEGEHSGRAIMAQQAAGMAELSPFYDNLRDWTIRVYRAMWNRIRQFWTEPRWVRITDETEKLQFVGINQPAQEPVVDPMTGQPAMGPDGKPVMQPVLGPDGQPMVDNVVGSLDVDIIIDMTPEYASLQQEQFESLVELAKSGMVQIPPDVLIQASQIRNKAQLLEKLNNPEAQQAQQAALALEMKGKEAEIAKAMAEAQAKAAEAGLKKMQLELDAKRAEMENAKMAMEARKAQSDELASQRDAQAKAQEMALKGREMDFKAQAEAMKVPETEAKTDLLRAQTQKTLAEIGLAQRQQATAERAQVSAEQEAQANRSLKTAEVGIKAQSEDNKVSMAKDKADADAKAAKSEGPKKPRKSRFKVIRGKDGLIEALDREDVE